MVQQNLETFLAQAAARDRCVPSFVEREFRKFLTCGLLCHGFVRVRCTDCGEDRLVAFSCRGRGFCPSCCSRRMSDTAAHLVDRVFPEVPTRQWVLTLPIPLRYRVAYDRTLCSAVLSVFIRSVMRSLRRRAKRHLGIDRGKGGSVTQIQRWGGAVNLNVHFHAIFLDGVYADPGNTGTPEFFPPPAPTDEEIARVAAASAQGIIRLLERRGLLSDSGDAAEDPLQDEEPLLAACAAASLRYRIATGPRRGKPVMRLGDRIEADVVEFVPGESCASVQGFSLHAGVAIDAHDRARLERLFRYIARPPIATKRLREWPDGRIAYELRHPWRDGTTHVVFTGVEFLEKLAVLTPSPRGNLCRYHGVFAPGAKWRSHGVRDRAPTESHTHGETPTCVQSPVDRASQATVPLLEVAPGDSIRLRERRLPWAELLRRVFQEDVLRCPQCGGRAEVISAITQPKVIQAILICLGSSVRAPPLSPARQTIFDL